MAGGFLEGADHGVDHLGSRQDVALDADVPSRAIREMLGSAFDLLVHVERFGDGSRRITSICEVGLTPDGFVTRELFKCTPAGQFEAVNIPKLLGRMELGDEEMTKWFGSLQSSNHA